MARMFWIKIWTEEWLDGSIREELTPVERSIWIDLLMLAGRSRTPGLVQSNPDKPYTTEYLANRFNVPLKDMKQALDHFIQQGRVDDIGTGLQIINWDKYQNAKGKIKGG